MFAYDSIVDFISKPAQNLFSSNINLYPEYALQAAAIVKSKISFNLPENNPPVWLKIPFVFILEYLIMSKFSGNSQEFVQMTNERYQQALKLLEDYKFNFNSYANNLGIIGTIQDAYFV